MEIFILITGGTSVHIAIFSPYTGYRLHGMRISARLISLEVLPIMWAYYRINVGQWGGYYRLMWSRKPACYRARALVPFNSNGLIWLVF
jgi:hypothetical protein